jgi:exopolysaccharide biosynthesis polyprenyl glycosylphosphotransferase
LNRVRKYQENIIEIMKIVNMKKTPKYKYIFGISDLLVIFISFFCSIYVLRQDESLGIVEFFSQSEQILLLFLFLSIVFIFIFQFNGLYRVNIILNRATHLITIIKALYYGALNIVLISFLIKSTDIIDSRLIIFTFIIFALPSLYFIRVELLRHLYIKLRNNQFRRNVIIVGDGNSGKLLATKLMFENPIGIEIVGFVDDDLREGEEVVGGMKVLGKISQLREIISKNKIDEILIAIEDEGYERLLEILDDCRRLKVNIRLTSELFGVVARRIGTEKYIDIPVINVSPLYYNKLNMLFKRIFDLIVAFTSLVLLSPLLILIAILVKLSSEGPVLFKSKAIGKNGKPFMFYKFRSMLVREGEDEERKNMMIEFMRENENSNGRKIVNLKRITWVGKILRKTSLDELPQLLNVLKGDMSLVGPRPALPYEYENYDRWHKRRVSVLPGCTGVWQVWGRSSVNFKESIVLDLYYINNMSPWLDLQLILQTIPAIFFFRGAK